MFNLCWCQYMMYCTYNTNVLNIWYINVYSLRKIYAKRQYSCLSFNG